MNIISDVAGRFDELMLLLIQMPKDEKILLVGDLMDRGPKSKEVIEWAINNPNVSVLKGNHEDMMIDYFENTNKYQEGIWIGNGGYSTLRSYGYEFNFSNGMYFSDEIKINKKGDVPKEHIEWLKQLPKFYKEEGLYVSHAPARSIVLGRGEDTEDFLWNRNPPQKVKGTFQIFGHNSEMEVYGDYAICIDNCSKNVLTGIHWPTKQVFQQDYLNRIKE